MICIECDKEKKHHAKGRCASCYVSYRRRVNKEYGDRQRKISNKPRTKETIEYERQYRKTKSGKKAYIKGQKKAYIKRRLKQVAYEGDQGKPLRKQLLIRCQGCGKEAWCPINPNKGRYKTQHAEHRIQELEWFRIFLSEAHQSQGVDCNINQPVQLRNNIDIIY